MIRGNKQICRRSLLYFVFMIFLFIFSTYVWALEAETVSSELSLLASQEKKPEIKYIMKRVRGTVSAKGPSGIAVEYAVDKKTGAAFEIYLPFDEEVKFEGYASKKEIREGDQVTLIYGETEDKGKRVLRTVTLGKKAEEETEENAVEMQAQEENQEGKK